MPVYTMSSIQSLPIQSAREFRLSNFHFRDDLLRIYTNLNKVNEDLASSHQIRKQNFTEMQKSLDAVNSVLKSSIRLRGKVHLHIRSVVFFFSYFLFLGAGQLGNMPRP